MSAAIKLPVMAVQWSCHAPTTIKDAAGDVIADIGGRGRSSAEDIAIAAELVSRINSGDSVALARSTIESQQRTMDDMAAKYSAAVNDTLEQAALACERRADSTREGAAVARQCAADIRAKKLPGAILCTCAAKDMPFGRCCKADALPVGGA